MPRTCRVALIAVSALIGGLVVAGPSAAAAPLATPTVSALSGTSGPLAGGTTVVVTGTSFSHVTKVLFGKTAGTHVHVSSSKKLSVRAPKSRAGTVDVRVVRSYRGSTKTSAAHRADHYTYVAAPAITKISPTSGSTAGGTTVTISGSNFQRITRVSIGGRVAGHLKIASTRRLTVTAPSHGAGKALVIVAGSYGSATSARLANGGFVYLSPPPAAVGSASSTSTSSTITLRWTNPSSAGFSGVLVRRLVGASAPASPTSGQLVADVTDDNVVTDTGLAAGTEYSYALFAHDASGRYARSTTVTAFTLTTAAAGHTWTGPTQPFGPQQGSPAGVSCPSSTFCQSVDSYGTVFTFDGTSWARTASLAIPDQYAFFVNIVCESATWCLASTDTEDVYHYDGTDWKAMVGADGGTVGDGDDITALSCASASFCVAATGEGDAVTFNGTAWSQIKLIDPLLGNTLSRIESLSCPAANFCAAGDVFGRFVTFNGSRWSAPKTVVDNGSHVSVSCTASTYCLAVEPTASTDTVARFDGTSWKHLATPSDLYAQSVECLTGSFCLVLGDGSASVYNGASFSTVEDVPSNGSVPGALSCPNTGFCVVLTQDGSTTRTAQGWADPTMFDPDAGGLAAVSCASGPFCLAADSAGNVKTYQTGVWSATAAFGSTPTEISCVSATFCAAVSGAGVKVFDGTSWTGDDGTPADNLEYVSCASTTFCLAMDNQGKTYSFNGSTWTHRGSLSLPSRYISGVSCVAASTCVAVATSEDDPDVASVGIVFDGTGWDKPVTISGQGVVAVSCAAQTFCLAVGVNGGVFRYNGSRWSAAVNLGVSLASVSCASTTFCIAAGGDTAAVFDGTTWSTPASIGKQAQAITGVSCTVDGFCLLDDDNVDAYQRS